MNESFVYGLFGGIIGFIYMGWICSPKSSQPDQPSLAVVDMKELISKKSQQLAAKLNSNNGATMAAISPASIQDVAIHSVAGHLKEDLKAFASTHNLVLLAKGAVISGDVPDKTEEILTMLEERER